MGEMERKLRQAFEPTHLEVVNESYKHCVPKDSETHFKVVIVSEKFGGVLLLERHRLVNETLAEELKGGVHALSIMAKTPAQWVQGGEKSQTTPSCLGGHGH